MLRRIVFVTIMSIIRVVLLPISLIIILFELAKVQGEDILDDIVMAVAPGIRGEDEEEE